MLEALVLGIVQGITEFFPISSTAHLVIFPWVFKWKGLVNSLSFDVALHAGTLASLVICFKRELIEMLGKKRRLLVLIALGTVPAGIAGITFHDAISGSLRSPKVIAAMLVLFGIVMYLSEKAKKRKKMDKISVVDAILIGMAQAVALVPGVSRSGVTIAAGLMRGVKREEAARFSFLLSMPAVFGATLLEGRKLLEAGPKTDWAVLGLGFSVSLVTGVVAIKFLLRYLKSHNMNAFVIYRFVLAGVIGGWIWLGG
jgi:undecaprenyl-diphosphatase